MVRTCCLVICLWSLCVLIDLISFFSSSSNGEKSCSGNTEDRGHGECNEDFECCNSAVSQCECPAAIADAFASLVDLSSAVDSGTAAQTTDPAESGNTRN
jgi:hypothetical protein